MTEFGVFINRFVQFSNQPIISLLSCGRIHTFHKLEGSYKIEILDCVENAKKWSFASQEVQ